MAKGKPACANEPLKVGDGLPEELLNYEFNDIELDKIISLLSQSKKTLSLSLAQLYNDIDTSSIIIPWVPVNAASPLP